MKRITGFLCALVLVFGISITAEAWYLELGSSYINTYGESARDITWEAGAGENLDGMSMAVTWDSGASPATSPFASYIPTITMGR